MYECTCVTNNYTILVKFHETVEKLTKAFDKQDFKLAKDLAIELQYWQSIQSAIHEWHQ